MQLDTMRSRIVVLLLSSFCRFAVILYILCELSTCFGAPFSDLDVLSLIDPITQFEEESEPKKVVVKSVFNVPIKVPPSPPPCPEGTRRVTESGPCVPKVSGIKFDDQFLLQSFSIFSRRRPTSPSPPPPPGHRRRKTTTTPSPLPFAVPTYVIEDDDQKASNLRPLKPIYSNFEGAASTFNLNTPNYQSVNPQQHVPVTTSTMKTILPEPTTNPPRNQPIKITSVQPTSAFILNYSHEGESNFTTESMSNRTVQATPAVDASIELKINNTNADPSVTVQESSQISSTIYMNVTSLPVLNTTVAGAKDTDTNSTESVLESITATEHSLLKLAREPELFAINMPAANEPELFAVGIKAETKSSTTQVATVPGLFSPEAETETKPSTTQVPTEPDLFTMGIQAEPEPSTTQLVTEPALFPTEVKAKPEASTTQVATEPEPFATGIKETKAPSEKVETELSTTVEIDIEIVPSTTMAVGTEESEQSVPTGSTQIDFYNVPSTMAPPNLPNEIPLLFPALPQENKLEGLSLSRLIFIPTSHFVSTPNLTSVPITFYKQSLVLDERSPKTVDMIQFPLD